MKILNNYNNNYNTNFCAKLNTENSDLIPEKRKSVEQEFERLTQDYPDDTFTLDGNKMIANIHNGDLTANFVEELTITQRNYYNGINRKKVSLIASEFAQKYKALREVSNIYKDGLEFAEKLKEKYSIDIGDSNNMPELFRTYSRFDCIMGSLLDVLKQARFKYRDKTQSLCDTQETLIYNSNGSIPEEEDAWVKYKDLKIPIHVSH